MSENAGINQAIEKLEKIYEKIIENDIRNAGSQDVSGSIIATEIVELGFILRGIEKVAGDEILQMNDAYNQSWDDRIAELLNKRIWGE